MSGDGILSGRRFRHAASGRVRGFGAERPPISTRRSSPSRRRVGTSEPDLARDVSEGIAPLVAVGRRIFERPGADASSMIR